MNRFIIALAATTALGAVPAAAQTGGNAHLRTDQLQTQLQAGVRSGAISRAEAMPLREQLRQLAQLERRYSRGGLSVRERSELQDRRASLRRDIRMAARSRGDRYDRDDRYADGRFGRDCPPGLDRRDNGCLPPGQVGRDDRDGRWGDDDRHGRTGHVDRNRDGYDDRDLNRDRRIDQREWRLAEERDRDDRRDGGRYDRDEDNRYDDDRHDDDRYDDRDTRRGGIGGVLDTLLGGGGLRVGQRASADLGAVPAGYRSRYRDGDGVYYRADRRSIYQIDARNDTVLQVYAMNR